jgi:meso-butanediol dehydrogenase / (S,S)-butanediol dehydrogenase / diacetyl reductase
MADRLAGKVAVITGSTSGFGTAIARLFAVEGAALVLNGRREDAGQALAAELGRDTRFVPGDVGDEATAEALAECARTAHGRIDALILNAGIGYPGVGPFWEVLPEEFDAVFRTNVRGAWLCARAAVPLMDRGGSIVVMASMSSFVVYPGETVYSASKGAALQLARGMAGDLAERGIRVNALCPGICDTPLTRYFIEASDEPTATEVEFEKFAPLGRMGTADEIAFATLFLASDESSYCTGASLLADGGATIR